MISRFFGKIDADVDNDQDFLFLDGVLMGVRTSDRGIAGRVLSLAFFGQPPSRIRLVLIWLSPLGIATLASKLAKVMLWRPTLPDGFNVGDRAKLGIVEFAALVATAPLTRALVALFIIDWIRRKAFPATSRWFTPLAAVVGFALAKALWSLTSGSPLVTESVFVSTAIQEARVLVSIFRSDVLFFAALVWFALGVDRLLHSRSQHFDWKWQTALLAPPIVVLGLELAYFRKTGLNGSIELLRSLWWDVEGFREIALSEVDLPSVACIALSLLLIPLAPLVVRKFTDPDRAAPAYSAFFGFGVLVSIGALALMNPPRLPPVYARFTEGTLPRLAKDMLSQALLPAAAKAAYDPSSPPLFDGHLEAEAAVRPTRNVVIVMLESVRASATSLHRPELANTPFLERMAAQGARVEQMYAVAPRTSMAWIALLDGIYPGDSDVMFRWSQLETRHHATTGLPRLLKSFGYRTGFFLPTHLRLQNDRQLVETFGFDDLVFAASDARGRLVAGNPLDPARHEQINNFGYADEALLEPIEAWVMARAQTRQPFLLTVMTNVGHYPYQLPRAWKHRTFAGVGAGDYTEYLNCVAYIDSYLESLHRILRDHGLLESTVIVILGDHGESFGEHGARQHLGQAYEEVLQVPAVVVAPGAIQPGQRVLGLRQQIDVLPTILDILGVRLTQGQLPGQSLLAAADAGRRLYFTGVYEESTLGLRENDMKFLYNYGRIPTEMYDLQSDPGETHDLGATASHEKLRQAEGEMLAWQAAVRRGLLSPGRHAEK